MDLNVRLFATLRDRAGQNSVRVHVSSPATVQDLVEAIEVAYPKLAPSLPTVLVAIDKNFAFPDTLIEEGSEVALFPPVSGGASSFPHPTYFAISHVEPDMPAIHAQLTQADVGAIVNFTGLVRGQTQREGSPLETLYLEYEAYGSMAEKKMAQIAYEIWERWPEVKGVAIVQRVGKLDISDVTTFITCAAGHRDQGVFEAARYGIDRLKEIVPVWKKEVGPDRSVWVEGGYQPSADDNMS